MCCEPRVRHILTERSGSDCCCCGTGTGHRFRRYVSARERIEQLEAYREELKNELAGVDEAVQELKGS